MLKIGKGLKKKKKSKKHKKDEELFKPEELEAYRREHQARLNEFGEESTGETSESKNLDNDEWKKFHELTVGVDTILKKTQDDLDRLKSTSFFKKVPPPKPTPPRQPVQESQQQAVSAEQKHEEVNATKEATSITPIQFLEDESESEYEEEEDIFDTSYVDVVASGEIKLAYVPDSPTEQETKDDFDPFDTSAAEKIISGPEVSKKGKKLVPIGPAVEILTGRVQNINTCVKKSPRRTQANIDLLLDTSDTAQVDSNGNITEVSFEEKPQKSLLDDDEPIPIEEPIDLSVSLLQKAQITPTTPTVEKGKQEDPSSFDIKEFDVLASKAETPDDLDDEFASLAAESLKTVKPTLDPNEIKNKIQTVNVEENWDAFGDLSNENKDELNLTNTSERKLSSVSIHLTDPSGESETIHNEYSEELNSLKPIHRDLLGGSTTDLSKLSNQPIEPVEVKVEESFESYLDPFDTSAVEQIKAPGKAEIKFIEAELLGDTETNLKKSLSDPDFDPRKDEVIEPVIINEQPFSVEDFELDENEEDPFDTSFVATVAPGKAELKLIENELAELETNNVLKKPNKLQEILSDPIKLSKPIIPPNTLDIEKETETQDLLAVEEEVNIKTLTPAADKQFSDEIELSYTDPFDTSVACNILPGKAELKLLENELLTIQSPVTVKPAIEKIASVLPTAFTTTKEEKKISKEPVHDLLTDLADNTTLEFKPLTPEKEDSTLQEDDFDPFDTSITTNLVPGKVELKLLESELIQ